MTPLAPRRLAALAAIIPLTLAGCATNSASKSADAKGFTVPPEFAEQYRDPLAASRLRERAFDLLVQMSRDPNPQLRANALEAIAVSSGRLDPLIPAALADQNVGVRSVAAVMVGRTQLKQHVPLVRPLLTDTSPYVRASAIYALNRCGERVDPSPLASILLRDPSPRVRSHVAFLLGEMGDPSALGLLREAARTQIPLAAPAEVRLMHLQIAEAMVKLGDESQISTIRAALYPSRPEDLEATALAVQILGQLRDRGSIDELIFLSARRDQTGQYWPAEIRLGVAGALARMGLNQGTFLADEYADSPTPALRAQSAFVYGQIGRTENLPKLAYLMEDPEALVRLAAAAGVVRMTDGRRAPGA